eukprot:scaffold677369_cov184-Prasinocladus_malaysianus.AAC.1
MWPWAEDLLEVAVAMLRKDRTHGPHREAGFLQFLQALRRSFLQDAPFLKEEWPEHPLWQEAFFQSEAFKKWECQMLEFYANAVKDELSFGLQQVPSCRLVFFMPIQ